MEDYRKFTEEEIKWIESLERVMEKAPENLFIFSGDGSFTVFPKDENGKRYMNKSGSVDQEAPHISITSNCESDGGAW